MTRTQLSTAGIALILLATMIPTSLEGGGWWEWVEAGIAAAALAAMPWKPSWGAAIATTLMASEVIEGGLALGGGEPLTLLFASLWLLSMALTALSWLAWEELADV